MPIFMTRPMLRTMLEEREYPIVQIPKCPCIILGLRNFCMLVTNFKQILYTIHTRVHKQCSRYSCNLTTILEVHNDWVMPSCFDKFDEIFRFHANCSLVSHRMEVHFLVIILHKTCVQQKRDFLLAVVEQG